MAKIQRNEPCPCKSGKKYKRCCGAETTSAGAGKRNERQIRVYTDETGNSGNKLFDSGQPYFWTGTLASEVDLEAEGIAIHAECLRLTAKEELHGNSLGLSGIEKIAPVLLEFFTRHDCHFFFTRLEKAHLAATKFFDVLMDSGVNKAVSNLHYGMRTLRLTLAVQLIQILKECDLREFWKSYESGDAAVFKEVLVRVRERLVAFHEEGYYHDRTVELLHDGLTWGISYPEPLIAETMRELDSPNIVAFSLLLSMLHSFHEETGSKVVAFFHDEQSQFAKSLQDSYQILRRFDLDRGITASMLDLKELPTFASEFVMCESKKSIGLQLIDVALWLTKRFRDNPGQIYGACRTLAAHIVKAGHISNFTLRDMQSGVAEMVDRMERKPITDEEICRGRELVEQLESIRRRRMRLSPEQTEIGETSVVLVQRGGRAAPIPGEFLCIGGRHDVRLTQCYCDLFSQ
jgi:hypothetical protein